MALGKTYTSYSVKNIMPAIGWQAVYWVDGVHEVTPIHALALAQHIEYESHWKVVRPSIPEEMTWCIVGVSYSSGDGWGVCDEAANYCGLIPPGETLETFECIHHKKKEPHPQTQEEGIRI